MLIARNLRDGGCPSLSDVSKLGLGRPFFYISANTFNPVAGVWNDTAGGLVGNLVGNAYLSVDSGGVKSVVLQDTPTYFDFGPQNFFDHEQSLTILLCVTPLSGYTGLRSVIGQSHATLGTTWYVRLETNNLTRLYYRSASGIGPIGVTQGTGWYDKPNYSGLSVYNGFRPDNPELPCVHYGTSTNGGFTYSTGLDLAGIRDVPLTVGAVLSADGSPINPFEGSISWVGIWRTKNITTHKLKFLRERRYGSTVRNANRHAAPHVHEGSNRYVDPAWWGKRNYLTYPRLGSQAHAVGDIVWYKSPSEFPNSLRKVLFIRDGTYYTEEISGLSEHAPAESTTKVAPLVGAGDTVFVSDTLNTPQTLSIDKASNVYRYANGKPTRVVRYKSSYDNAEPPEASGLRTGGITLKYGEFFLGEESLAGPVSVEIGTLYAKGLYATDIDTTTGKVIAYGGGVVEGVSAIGSRMEIHGYDLYGKVRPIFAVSSDVLLQNTVVRYDAAYRAGRIVIPRKNSMRRLQIVSSNPIDNVDYLNLSQTGFSAFNAGEQHKPLYKKAHRVIGSSPTTPTSTIAGAYYKPHNTANADVNYVMTDGNVVEHYAGLMTYNHRNTGPESGDDWCEWVLYLRKADYYDFTVRLLIGEELLSSSVASAHILYRDSELNFKIYRDLYDIDPYSTHPGFTLGTDSLSNWEYAKLSVYKDPLYPRYRTVRIHNVATGRVRVRMRVFPFTSRQEYQYAYARVSAVSPILEVA